MQDNKWKIWIDRGGTFTDIAAQKPSGEMTVHKLLSENVEQYRDAPVQGIKEVMGLAKDAQVPVDEIEEIKMGTTVATNALLEREGERTVLVTTEGFRDALRIGYQERPDLFARNIELPEMLYEEVIEVQERYSAKGEEKQRLTNTEQLKNQLKQAYEKGIRSCAIVLMHGYRYPAHEKEVGRIAEEIGFDHISLSHQVSPLMKLVSRGDTTVADAYLSPVLNRYIDNFLEQLFEDNQAASISREKFKERLLFMQSNGGLIESSNFKGKDSILSGPAGGIVGAVQVCKQAGFDRVISFDMGGTSTDVAHYKGEYERDFETEIAGVRLRTPVLSIHTVAAGGGSKLHFSGGRFRVGPDSAGADPGPVCYRKGGPLTVTDCNVMLGRIQPKYFPSVFGEDGKQPLDKKKVEEKFEELTEEVNQETENNKTLEEVASGFLEIAIENMANAIKKISLQRGYDISNYVLCCFGGAGGQHVCRIAENLGVEKILIHPYAGLLSAYGMGLANIRAMNQQAVEEILNQKNMADVAQTKDELIKAGRQELEMEEAANYTSREKLHLKYEGSDFTLKIDYDQNYANIKNAFEEQHKQLYGFTYQDKEIILEAVSVEVIQKMDVPEEKSHTFQHRENIPHKETISVYVGGEWQEAPLYIREELQPGDTISGPALIIEETGTNVILENWQAQVNEYNHLLLTKQNKSDQTLGGSAQEEEPDPMMLEIFNNLYRSIAEQMGVTLQKTAFSVNIKERLDFSCAIFDKQGNLVANAPHIPVHLGSMSESVRALIQDEVEPKQGDVFASNNPYNGGTHLPDITVITPVFLKENSEPVFYVASRGHHADIGGVTPGSMPPFSTHIEEEGILLDNVKIVSQGKFQTEKVKQKLSSAQHPVRNITQNITDLKAQIAANKKGVSQLMKIVDSYGFETVKSYMKYVQQNAAEAVKCAITNLSDGSFSCQLDTGDRIDIDIQVNEKDRTARLDFRGTSKETDNNFNAPIAITRAAILYVFRTLVEDIPLNEGCLAPLEIIVPEGCLLNPTYPSAVVAGNVETSQLVVDSLMGALDIMAGSQGTMNNFTFGNDELQYYETICGGTGAGPDHKGTDAVHSHMTNSRLTDPEVLEWRFPVMVDEFSIRENSGGQGQYSGGNGVVRKIKFLEQMEAGILSNRRSVSPFGLKGGQPGATGENLIQTEDGIEKLSSTDTARVEAGDVFIIKTPGGGGYGEN